MLAPFEGEAISPTSDPQPFDLKKRYLHDPAMLQNVTKSHLPYPLPVPSKAKNAFFSRFHLHPVTL